MADTTRRVTITHTFATDVEPDHVMLGAIEGLPDALRAVLESTSVHEFDLAEPDQAEPMAYLVIADGIVQAATVNDLDAASSAASACQGVVAELPLAFAYSPKGTDR